MLWIRWLILLLRMLMLLLLLMLKVASLWDHVRRLASVHVVGVPVGHVVRVGRCLWHAVWVV